LWCDGRENGFEQIDGGPGFALTSQNVEDDIGGLDAVAERFGASR
jgi:hypothetical protein